MAGAALTTCFGQPVTETRGGWNPRGWLTARQLELSRSASEGGWSEHPGPGLPGPGDPVTLADRPSGVLLVLDSDP